MTNDSKKNPAAASADEIVRQIEAFGADRSRWTKSATDDALRQEPVANARREAEALDRLLAMAAPAKASGEANRRLADRIVAAAERTPRVVSAKAPPVAIKVTAGAPRDNVAKFERRSALTRNIGSDVRRGFAVLAASLVLGLSIGQSGLMDRAMIGFEDLTGVAIAPVSQDIAGALNLDASGEDL